MVDSPHAVNERELVELLYAAFAKYSVSHPMEGCPCCVREGDQQNLRTPPRQLAADALARYSAKAMSTWWGDVSAFKHFLPRILELLPTAEAASYHGLQPWLVAGKLTDAEWTTWPANEQALIREYFRRLWLAFVDGKSDATAPEMVQTLRALGEDLGPWLALWDPMRSANAAAELALALEDRRPMDQEFSDWLRSPERLRALEGAFEAYLDTPHADQIAAAVDQLLGERG